MSKNKFHLNEKFSSEKTIIEMLPQNLKVLKAN